jgi:hypothetical protein
VSQHTCRFGTRVDPWRKKTLSDPVTVLTLQEDLPKGSRVEAYLYTVRVPGLLATTYDEVELVPVRTEHVGVTEDKGAELALSVPDHHHIQDGDVLTITLPKDATMQDHSVATVQLSELVSHTRAAAGLVLIAGQQFGVGDPEEVMRALDRD